MLNDENNQNSGNTENNGNNGDNQNGEGKISGFFKKLGRKFDDATYEMRLVNDFTKKHKKYTVYASASTLAATPEIAVEEHLDEGYLLTIDDDEQIAAGNLIKGDESEEVRHIASVEQTTLTIDFEGKVSDKPALKIFLGEPAEKVDVIKVGNEFYLK